jgi:hypothetical protein
VSGSILLDEQLLWLVILGFYLLDNVKHLSGFQIVLREQWNLRWRAELPSPSLAFAHRQLHLLNPLLPYGLAIRLPWLTDNPNDPAKIRRADRLLRLVKRRLSAYRCLSAAGFVAFFILGPSLTYLRGLGFALWHVAPVYLLILAGTILLMIADRKFWRLSGAKILGLSLEYALCPGYLVNITRKMTWDFVTLAVDGGRYGWLRSTAEARQRLESGLGLALEELEQECEGDAAARARLLAYARSVMS